MACLDGEEGWIKYCGRTAYASSDPHRGSEGTNPSRNSRQLWQHDSESRRICDLLECIPVINAYWQNTQLEVSVNRHYDMVKQQPIRYQLIKVLLTSKWFWHKGVSRRWGTPKEPKQRVDLVKGCGVEKQCQARISTSGFERQVVLWCDVQGT
jgi:hypothetical protein